uniref:Uncharacterized protein n=1 Tax=Thermosporothrix sp. COM3 TaxID=2490863 RepID=A0A455SH81_9CHLR|nr:hypothetical protein KTC_18570 [Thermosporothrix sp. COM3]
MQKGKEIKDARQMKREEPSPIKMVHIKMVHIVEDDEDIRSALSLIVKEVFPIELCLPLMGFRHSISFARKVTHSKNPAIFARFRYVYIGC